MLFLTQTVINKMLWLDTLNVLLPLCDGALLFYPPLRVDEDEEIIVKAMTDYWVVGKKSDQRELYVILNQKNANLIEVNGMSPPPGDEQTCVITQ